ncbi:MAG TPA: 3-dehydroquinate synthase [Gemmatimonadales bacterium]|nr:3-dehydroquinate synthase [Gemmatimonadales bacterium]
MKAADAAVRVAHAAGSYPVYVESGLLAQLPALLREHLGAARVAVIGDATVAALHAGGLPWPVLTFPAGEASKSRAEWARLSDALLALGLGRDGAIVALGGGVTGDLAGFVAATYLRGIPYVQVPTTLLAMVDSSVGGKTGVDTPHGKNLVGAFHHPAAVVADPRVLATLPERDFRSGLAEAVKHGLVADADYFAWLEAAAPAILARDEAALTALVRRSVELKARIVAADEREAGLRAVLNAGHTVGHALEHVSRYALTHGEAVALGLVAETALAESLGVAEPGTRERTTQLLATLGLPTRLPAPLPADALLAAMAADKKNRAGGEVAEGNREAAIRCALPAAVGRMDPADGAWTRPGADAALRDALSMLTAPREPVAEARVGG